MVNLLFARLVALLLVVAMCLAVVVLTFGRTSPEVTGAIIGSAGSIALLAAKGIYDYDDSAGSPKA